MKKVISLCICLLLLSCKQDSKLKSKISTLVTSANEKYIIDTLTGDTLRMVSSKKIDKKKKTRISYEETQVDLGTVVEGTKVKHSFKFRNTGNEPLIIHSAYGSCGCTVPSYPKEAIMPGEESKIDVVFNSSGRVGPNTKSVIVSANTVPQETQINFSVSVTKKE